MEARKMRKTQNPRNILYLVLSIVIAAGIWYYVDEFNDRYGNPH